VSAAGYKMSVEHRQPADEGQPGRRVLVVDDHASFRSCARALLTAEGFDVIGEAVDGASAVALASELGPEWVLLDIQLPDMDGFAVTERLLADDPELQIVLVSSRDRSSYGSLIEDSGARGFLAKAELSGESLEGLLG
jgi:DNA-binding NarL/FixJ family response regulator